jgi:hypothetical protein
MHSHNTRNSSIIPTIRTRTSLCTNYFLPATIRPWNLLPERIKSSTLKSNLKSNHPQKPPYYYIGKRLGQILHFRLRMHCSSLKPVFLLKQYCWLPALSMWCYWNNRTLFVILPSLQRTQTAFYWALIWRSSDFICSLSLWIVDIFLAVQSFIINSKRFNRN